MKNNENEMQQSIKTGIYKITNPNGKVYIGQSIDIDKRWNKYKVKNCKPQIRLYNSLNKYGWENHYKDIIEECDIDELNEREVYWKQHYLDKNGWENVLFCELYDTGGGPRSEEIKNKISIGNTSKSKPGVSLALKNKPKPQGFGEKISKALKGTKQKEETIIKRSIKAKGRKHSTFKKGKNHGNYCKPKSLEHSKKISECKEGKNRPFMYKPILQYDLEGNFIKEWSNINEAIIKTNSKGISNNLTGRNKSAGGFIWKYKNI